VFVHALQSNKRGQNAETGNKSACRIQNAVKSSKKDHLLERSSCRWQNNVETVIKLDVVNN
jgi:hypothetical protein